MVGAMKVFRVFFWIVEEKDGDNTKFKQDSSSHEVSLTHSYS